MSIPKVFELGPEHVDEAVDILHGAFENYPMIRYFFEHLGPGSKDAIDAMFRVSCRVRLALDWPLHGCELDGKLVGAAYVTPSVAKEIPDSLRDELQQFNEIMGPIASERFGIYQELKAKYQPIEAHVYLQAIGVIPEAQGTGSGGALLDAIHEYSEADPLSAGVALDTQLEKNVSLYEKYGYRVTGEAKLEDVACWFMFRPNGVA